MASVSSLDKDLRRLRLEKYTVSSANEVRDWIESSLGEKLLSDDLLESLRDGVALCKLVNLVIPPPGLRFKKSAMPFVQMENISLFLKACQSPPINLLQHDMFLTVDLYEQKDPAQVLQCIGSFSRAAHIINPAKFPNAIGPPVKSRPGGALSPQPTGNPPIRGRAFSNASNASNTSKQSAGTLRTSNIHAGSDRLSPISPDPTRKVSTWARKDQEGSTSPAWNIAQYGYIGGASQGNLGIAFGGRRQITASGPSVPSLQQKESARKKKAEEEERQKREMEEETKRRQAERAAEEERVRLEEERKWAEETQRARDKERMRQEEEKKRWKEEERQWKITEEKRKQEEAEAERRIADERRRVRSNTRPSSSNSILTDHFLSHYASDSSEPVVATNPSAMTDEVDYRGRVRELEKELEQARQREQEYERERQGRLGIQSSSHDSRQRSKSRNAAPARPPSRHDSWSRDQREVLTTPKTPTTSKPSPLAYHQNTAATKSPRPLPVSPPKPARPAVENMPPTLETSPASAALNRTDRFLSSHVAPTSPPAHQTYSRELDATYERDAEDRRRIESQEKTKAAGWAGKSLLEREMEMERQRQREWESEQQETAKAQRTSDGVDGIGGGIGGRWDVSQFSGYTGGDNLNRTDRGGIGATRRQIVGGPRPLR
ncbi:Transgelin [Ceratocystis fimbriata CBS 114723]|uniref:Transgelin n=1 Tax=Ceratocystis fimbriata CBS 114723 TaxID=1035309 RepID=A0A2C5X766_9PEZI|nr:Transgelin [Ceratocystis fimbriata CBS 114723]